MRLFDFHGVIYILLIHLETEILSSTFGVFKLGTSIGILVQKLYRCT